MFGKVLRIYFSGFDLWCNNGLDRAKKLLEN